MNAYDDGFNDGYCRAMTKVDELKDQLSTLKAILEKKDEALKELYEYEARRSSPDTAWTNPMMVRALEALSLTPETYVKEEGEG